MKIWRYEIRKYPYIKYRPGIFVKRYPVDRVAEMLRPILSEYGIKEAFLDWEGDEKKPVFVKVYYRGKNMDPAESNELNKEIDIAFKGFVIGHHANKIHYRDVKEYGFPVFR